MSIHYRKNDFRLRTPPTLLVIVILIYLLTNLIRIPSSLRFIENYYVLVGQRFCLILCLDERMYVLYECARHSLWVGHIISVFEITLYRRPNDVYKRAITGQEHPRVSSLFAK